MSRKQPNEKPAGIKMPPKPPAAPPPPPPRVVVNGRVRNDPLYTIKGQMGEGDFVVLKYNVSERDVEHEVQRLSVSWRHVVAERVEKPALPTPPPTKYIRDHRDNLQSEQSHIYVPPLAVFLFSLLFGLAVGIILSFLMTINS